MELIGLKGQELGWAGRCGDRTVGIMQMEMYGFYTCSGAALAGGEWGSSYSCSQLCWRLADLHQE